VQEGMKQERVSYRHLQKALARDGPDAKQLSRRLSLATNS
jgi:hypothetical protein